MLHLMSASQNSSSTTSFPQTNRKFTSFNKSNTTPPNSDHRSQQAQITGNSEKTGSGADTALVGISHSQENTILLATALVHLTANR